MKKILTLILSFAFVLASFSMIAVPALAQTEDSTVTYDDWDDWDDDWWDEGTTTDTFEDITWEGDEELAALFGGAILVVTFGSMFFMYIYSAITLSKIAKNLNHENGWFAWIPILNAVLLFKMGDLNPLLVLLALIPAIGALAVAILSIIAFMNICEKRGYEKLLGLLAIVPVGNLVLLGMLAWGKKKESSPAQTV